MKKSTLWKGANTRTWLGDMSPSCWHPSNNVFSRLLPEKVSSTFDLLVRSALRSFQNLRQIQPVKLSLPLSRAVPTFSLIPTFCVLFLFLCVLARLFCFFVYSVFGFFLNLYFSVRQPSPFLLYRFRAFLSFAKRTVCV